VSAPSSSDASASPEAQRAPFPLPPGREDLSLRCQATVRCGWDGAAGLFFVQEASVPGLVCGAPTIQALMCELPGRIRALLGLDAEAYIDVFVERVAR